MNESDLFGWIFGTLSAVLLIVALSQGCRKVEKTVPTVDLRALNSECEVFVVEEQRFLICKSGNGLTVTPLETKCNPK